MLIDLTHTYDSYHEILDHYGRWDCICPKCEIKGKMHRHAFYERFLCVLDKGHVVDRKLNILRLKCEACGSTHAVLTMDMIPFYIYSFSLILDIVRSVLVQKMPVLKKEKESSISFQTIYRFICLWQLYFESYSVFSISNTTNCPYWTKKIISEQFTQFIKRKSILQHHFCLGLIST